MKKQKINAAAIFSLASVICYLVSIFGILKGASYGILYLCLGSMFLCLASARKMQEKKNAEAEKPASPDPDAESEEK